jgi:hypothetical protein
MCSGWKVKEHGQTKKKSGPFALCSIRKRKTVDFTTDVAYKRWEQEGRRGCGKVEEKKPS